MLHTSIGNYLGGGLLLGILGGKLGLVKSLLKTHLLYISVGKKCCFWFSNCNYNVCIFSYYVAHCVSSHFTIWVKKQFFGVSNMTKRKKIVAIGRDHWLVTSNYCDTKLRPLVLCFEFGTKKNYRSNISDVLETRMIQKTDRINTFLNCQEYHRVLRNSK